jgi:hypothetical protein
MEHVNEGAQRDRYLSVTGIVKKEPLKKRRPIFEDAKQLARAQKRGGHSFGDVCDSQFVDGRANRQIGIVDDDRTIDCYLPRLTFLVKLPFEIVPSVARRY